MTLEFREITNEDFNAGRKIDYSVPELNELRINFPSNLEDLRGVIYKVISHKTRLYDDLVIKAIQVMKEQYNVVTTYQNIRYLILSELMNRKETKELPDGSLVDVFTGHKNALCHLHSIYGKEVSSEYLRRFAGILKRNNIGSKSNFGYYSIKSQPGYGSASIRRVIKSLDFRKPYSIPALQPALIMSNLLYIIDKKNADTKDEDLEVSSELLYTIDEE